MGKDEGARAAAVAAAVLLAAAAAVAATVAAPLAVDPDASFFAIRCLGSLATLLLLVLLTVPDKEEEEREAPFGPSGLGGACSTTTDLFLASSSLSRSRSFAPSDSSFSFSAASAASAASYRSLHLGATPPLFRCCCSRALLAPNRSRKSRLQWASRSSLPWLPSPPQASSTAASARGDEAGADEREGRRRDDLGEVAAFLVVAGEASGDGVDGERLQRLWPWRRHLEEEKEHVFYLLSLSRARSG